MILRQQIFFIILKGSDQPSDTEQHVVAKMVIW